MLSSHYFLSEIDYITQRLQRFKYTCVATFGNWAAFGSPTGSIHVFNLETQKQPIVISLSSISTSIKLMSFSPNGNFLLVVEENKVSLIENPTNSANLTGKIDVKGKEITASYWFIDPPTKLLDRTTPFLCLGDKEGGVWVVSHNTTVQVCSVPSTVYQISQVQPSKQLIINAEKGAYFVNDKYAVSQIRSKRPNGCFGGIFVERFNAICFARVDGKLLLATPEGKSKVMLPLFEKGKPEDLPENVNINLSILQLCGPFLISTGSGSAALIINLDAGKLDNYLFDNSPFIDSSSSSDTTIFVWQNKVVKMKVCASNEEYMDALLEQKKFRELQEFAIEAKIKDIEKLESFVDPENENKEYNDYIDKVKLMMQPQPLSVIDEALFKELCEGDVPRKETVDKVHEMLADIVVDEDVQKRIQVYVLNNPAEWKDWSEHLKIDELIAVLNEKEETASFAIEMSSNGTSELAKILSQIDTLPIDYCVANYPVIHNYNLSGARRKLFDELVRVNDIFSYQEDVDDDEDNEVLDDSPYTTRVEHDEEFTPEEAHKLLLDAEWEDEINEAVDELHKKAEAYFLSREVSPVPSWVKDTMNGVKTQQQCSGCGNWGATSQIKDCPICGMQLNMNDDTSNVALFPCAHAFHVSCLGTRRYCPVCYNLSLD